MKIAEIVGSYADSEQQIASNDSLFQTIANAFTRSGKVKRPLNQRVPYGQPIASHAPFASVAAPDEDPVAHAVSNIRSDAPPIPTTQIHRSAPQCHALAAADGLESGFYRVE
jgi:hypothetical protein